VSLSAATIINNIQAPNRDGVVSSLSALSNAPGGLFFRTDVNRLTYIPVVPYSNQSIRFWEPATGVNEDYLQLGIADADQAPTSGTTALEYDGDTSGLTAVSATISAANLQTAINANTTVIATGQTVAVTEISDGQFQVDWSGVGAKELIGGTGEGLIPESNVFSAWLREGDGSTKASQLLQFVQRPLVYVDSWTAGGSPVATVTELVTGAGGVKAMFQISISGLLYEGTFSVNGSAAIAFDANEADMLAALGSGWGSVVKTADGLYTVERAAVGVYALVDGDVDISALSAFGHFIGTLGFNKAALFQRFADEDGDSFTTSLQIRHDDGTNADTLLFIPVTLHKDILSPAATAPTNWNALFYTKVQTDALIADFTEGPASSTNNNLAAFDGTDGKLLKDSGVAVSTDGALASNSDAKLPTEKAVTTYVRAGSPLVAVAADRALALSDVGKSLQLDDGSDPIEITIPANATIAFALGNEIELEAIGTGTYTVTAASGVTLNNVSVGSTDIAFRTGAVRLKKLATNTWLINGDYLLVA
jgi:hypothetical protein